MPAPNKLFIFTPMKNNLCPMQPDPAYKAFAGVFPDPYQVKSGWRMRYRLAVNGKPKTVAGNPSDPEFAASHAALIAQCLPASPVGRPVRGAPSPRIGEASTWSLDMLIDYYFKHDRYAKLKSNIQRGQVRKHLTSFRDFRNAARVRFGDSPFVEFKSHDIKEWLATVEPARPDRPGKHGGKSVRANWLRTVKVLFGFANDEELSDRNPAKFKDPKRTYKYKVVGSYAWTNADRIAFREHWPIGSMQRLAFELADATGLRLSDLQRIGPDMVQRDGYLRFPAVKGDERLRDYAFNFAGARDLQRIIAATKPGNPKVTALRGQPWITNTLGTKFGRNYLGTWFAEAARVAGCDPRCTLHGVRAGSAVAIWEATGGALGAVMDHLDHKNPSTTEIYLKDRVRGALADVGREARRQRTAPKGVA